MFKMGYFPEKVYTQTTDQTLRMEMTLSGSDEIMAVILAQGMPNPMVQDAQQNIGTVITTGETGPEGEFPITIEVLPDTETAGDISLKNMKMTGRCKAGGQPVFDSIVSEGVKEEARAVMLQTIQSVLSQIDFPEQEIGVGDEFVQVVPLSIPAGPMTFTMSVNTTYKLTRISGGMAWFDLVYDISMDIPAGERTPNMTATGSGTGKMTYDIKENFSLEMENDMKMVMSVQAGGVDAAIDMQIVQVQNTVISPAAR